MTSSLVSFAALVIAGSNAAGILGTISEGKYPGIERDLDTYWELCIDKSGQALWKIDGTVKPYTVTIPSENTTCFRDETGNSCVELQIENDLVRMSSKRGTSEARIIAEGVVTCQDPSEVS